MLLWIKNFVTNSTVATTQSNNLEQPNQNDITEICVYGPTFWRNQHAKIQRRFCRHKGNFDRLNQILRIVFMGCVEHRLKIAFVTKTTWYRFEFESILVFEPSQKRCIPIKRILFPIDQTYSGSTGSIFLLWECIGLFRSCFYGDTDGA